jgi:hypothetical protein
VFADPSGHDPRLTVTGQCTFPGPVVLVTHIGDLASAEKKEWRLLLSISSLGGAGYRSWIRDGGLTYFDLSTASADFEAWLWVHGWSVNDMAIFKVKLGSVIARLPLFAGSKNASP